jgi:hypothetical protein
MGKKTIPEDEPNEEEHEKELPFEPIKLSSTPLKNRPGGKSSLEELLDEMDDDFKIVTMHVGVTAPAIASTKREGLQDWWHNLLRKHGRFYCYGVFLMLEADLEAFKYVTEYALELNQASGKNCAILGLGDFSDENSGKFDKFEWSIIVYHQLREGNSLKIAELFHIPLTQFPGVILFRDIRSAEYILVKLRRLTAEEIAEKMRGVYQAINQAADAKKDPLEAVRNLRSSDEYRVKTRSIISGTRKVAGQTLETVIEAIIKAIIK